MILLALGKDAIPEFGYKKFETQRGIHLGIFEVIWNIQTKIWGIGFGLPYLFAIGIIFKPIVK